MIELEFFNDDNGRGLSCPGHIAKDRLDKLLLVTKFDGQPIVAKRVLYQYCGADPDSIFFSDVELNDTWPVTIVYF